MASLEGVAVIEGSAVELMEEGTADKVTGVRYKGKEGEGIVNAHLTVVCDGGFSRFRNELHQGEQTVKGFMVGLLLKDCQLPYPGHGHVILTGRSPILIYPVSSKETRMLVDFPGTTSPKQSGEAAAYFTQVEGYLPESLRPAFREAVDGAKFKAMPNQMLPAKPERKQGAILLGDALNMRHPLTGGGMTVALTDVHQLGERLAAIEDLSDNASLEHAVEDFYCTRHHDTSTINILADALYDVMSHPDLKRACYDYLKRGGRYAEVPISILSAVSRDKDQLTKEFFSVGIYGSLNLLKPIPGPQSLYRSYDLMREAVNIIKPLLMNEQPGLQSKMAMKLGGWLFPEREGSKTTTAL